MCSPSDWRSAVLALSRRGFKIWGVVALALAALTKDQYVLVAAGLAGWEWFRTNRREAVLLGVGAATPLLIWSIWLTATMGEGLTPRGNFSLPLLRHLRSCPRLGGYRCQGPDLFADRSRRCAAGSPHPAVGTLLIAGGSPGPGWAWRWSVVNLGVGFRQQLAASLRPAGRVRRAGDRRSQTTGRGHMSRARIPDRNPVHSLPWIILGMLVAIVASGMPLSHDEAFWLAISRKVEAGARLYDEAIDNKPPSVYLGVYLLDHLPGSFKVARGLLVGGLIGWIGLLSARLSRFAAVSKQQR